jgi:hypothetical protein
MFSIISLFNRLQCNHLDTLLQQQGSSYAYLGLEAAGGAASLEQGDANILSLGELENSLGSGNKLRTDIKAILPDHLGCASQDCSTVTALQACWKPGRG